ncbi:MAG: acyl-CoA dehydrogenase family protein [Acidimicrobiales bacterium]
MRDFALAAEVEELRAAADRLARRELAPAVRDSEAAGRWPDEVLAVLRGFPLGGLDLPARLGGVEAGLVAKAAVLETLAHADAGGLAAADQPGSAAGALDACPDHALAAEIAGACLEGAAQCAFTVRDREMPAAQLDWAPSWPALRWVWVSDGDDLVLLEATGEPTPGLALAFQASGAVTLPYSQTGERGRWTLSPREALAVRGRARLWGAAVAVGVSQAALEETIEYTTERIVFGKPVAHHQGNAFDLAAAAAGVHAARLVVRDAAAAFDRGEPDAGFWATQAWLETMDAAFTATNVGIQLLGGHGFIVDHLAEKRFREARMLALAAGARDAAEHDAASHVLDVPDALLASLER